MDVLVAQITVARVPVVEMGRREWHARRAAGFVLHQRASTGYAPTVREVSTAIFGAIDLRRAHLALQDAVRLGLLSAVGGPRQQRRYTVPLERLVEVAM